MITAQRALARFIVRLASGLVPRDRRDDWLEEWLGELWAAGAPGPAPGPREGDAARGAGSSARRPPLVRTALGSVRDALAVRALAGEHGAANGWIDDGNGFLQEEAVMMGRETRVAVRSLLRTPGFTTVAVATLALGIGGATAIWSLIDRVVLDPLPFPESGRLVRVMNQVPGVGPDEVWNASTAQYVFYDENARALDLVGVYNRGGVNIETPSGPERASAATVTAEVLQIVGARAALGRTLVVDDNGPQAPPVVVLSHGFWTRTFGADPSVVGNSLVLSGTPTEVVGVLEPGADLPPDAGSTLPAPDLWVPMTIDRAGQFWNSHSFRLVGRLAPDATPEAAERELAALREGLPERFPVAYGQAFFDRYGFRTTVTPLQEYAVGDLGEQLWILLGAVGIVLLIACANVANLFLVRIEERRRELAVRAALGAGGGAIARYLLAESAVLAVAGGLGALLVVWQGLPLLVAVAPDSLPRMDAIGMGGSAFAAAALLSLAVTGFLTLVPLARLGRTALRNGLAEGGRAGGAGRDRQRLRTGLVASQVALALTLAVGAGLLLESMGNLRDVDPGLDPKGVVTARVHLSQPVPTAPEIWVGLDAMLDRVREIPGVIEAGMVPELPLSGGYGCWIQGFEDEAVVARVNDAGQTTCAGFQMITPGYFAAMGIPVLEGRDLDEGDLYDPSRASVVVSRAFADRFWPGESAIGKGVKPGGVSDDPFYRVVGVVGDIHGSSLQGEKALAIYYPVVPVPPVDGPRVGNQTLVVKTDLDDPLSVIPAVRRALAEVDPGVPLSDVQSMETVVEASMGRLAFVSLLLQVAATVALLLAAVGLYGVISYVVARRTREIGMRMALGARPGQVQQQIVGRSVRLAVVGLAVGVVLAVTATRVLEGLLFGVEPTQPTVYVAAAALLAGVAALAAWLPARRAARIDPSEALRFE